MSEQNNLDRVVVVAESAPTSMEGVISYVNQKEKLTHTVENNQPKIDKYFGKIGKNGGVLSAQVKTKTVENIQKHKQINKNKKQKNIENTFVTNKPNESFRDNHQFDFSRIKRCPISCKKDKSFNLDIPSDDVLSPEQVAWNFSLAHYMAKQFLGDDFMTEEVLGFGLPDVNVNLGESTLAVIAELQGTIHQFSDAINNISDKGLAFQVGLDDKSCTIMDKAKYPLMIILGIAAYKSLTTRTSGWLIILTGASSLVASTWSNEFSAWVKPLVSKIYQVGRTGDAPIAQSPSDPLGLLTQLILGTVAYTSVNRVVGGAKVDRFLQLSTMLPRAEEGIYGILTMILQLVQSSLNFVRVNYLDLPGINLINTAYPELDRWCGKVQCLIEEARLNRFAITVANSDRIQALQMEGVKLSTLKAQGIDGVTYRTALSTHTTALRKLAQPFEAANLRRGGPRMEPVAVMLRGPSGVGKSWATFPFLNDVLGRVLPAEQLPDFEKHYSDFVYQRQAEQKFWDGYYGQLVTIFDDFGQARDTVGVPDNEYMDAIRVCNLFPNNLHMASLEQKGTTYFKSKLVLFTTNLQDFKPESIIEPEAFIRRMDFIVDVVPKKEFCVDPNVGDILKRRLDKEKVQSLFKTFNPNIYEFYPWDKKNNCRGKPIDYVQFYSDVVSMYQKSEGKCDAYKSYLDLQVSELVANRAALTSGICANMNDRLTCQMEIPADPIAETSYDVNQAEEIIEREIIQDASEIVVENISLEDLLQQDESFDDEQYYGLSNTRFLNACLEENHRRLLFSELYEFEAFRDCDLNLVGEVLMERYPEVMDYVNREKDYKLFYKFLKKLEQQGVDVQIVATLPSNVPPVSDSRMQRAKDKLERFIRAAEKKVNSSAPPAWEMLKTLSAVLIASFSIVAMFQGYQEASADVKQKFDLLNFDPPPWEGQEEDKDKTRNEIVKGKFKSESPYWARYKEKTRGRARKLSRAVPSVNNFVAEGGADVNCEETINKVARKSLYGFKLPKSSVISGYMIVVRNRVCLLPYHYIPTILSGIESGHYSLDDKVTLVNMTLKHTYEVALSHILEHYDDGHFKENDITMMELPKQVHLHPDISKCFISESEAEYQIARSVRLVSFNESTTGIMQRTGEAMPLTKPLAVYDSTGSEHWNVVRGWWYRLYTKAGDCGSLLLRVDPASNGGKILGMHIAGSPSGVGLCTLITKEELDVALKSLDSSPAVRQEDFKQQMLDTLPFKGEFAPLYRVGRVHEPRETKIRKSELYEAWGPARTAPAQLRAFESNGVTIIPKFNAIEKYGVKSVFIDETIVGIIASKIVSSLVNIERAAPFPIKKIYTFEEAVTGIPGLIYCDAIPRNTSPGYPYVLETHPGFPGKTWWFGKGQDYSLSNPAALALKEEVSGIIVDAKNGIRRLHAFVDFLKDERREHEKVEIGKTRLISAAPLALTVVTRMYFMDFARFIMCSHNITGITVGINPYSDDWNLLAMMLTSKGKCVVAGDFKNFDGSEQSVIHLAICDIINKWYDDGKTNAHIRQVLWMEVYNSVHVCEDMMYQWTHSLPSGHPMTTIINCLYNKIAFMLAWQDILKDSLTGERSVDVYKEFDENVFLAVYGDDNVCNVSDKYIDLYNQHTITESLKKFGMHYTTEAKDGVAVKPWRTLEEVTFLKRGFRYEKILGRFVAPLSLDVILEIPYWYKKGPIGAESVPSNVDNTIEELSLHEPQVFAEWIGKITNASRYGIGYFPPVTDRTALIKQVSGRSDYW